MTLGRISNLKLGKRIGHVTRSGFADLVFTESDLGRGISLADLRVNQAVYFEENQRDNGPLRYRHHARSVRPI